MTAAETIAAAIEKLEGERKATNDGQNPDWHVSAIPNNDRLNQADIVDGEQQVVIERCWAPDADLIVTLHRTIDAQLAILRHAVEHPVRVFASPEEAYDELALNLARAIVGEPS